MGYTHPGSPGQSCWTHLPSTNSRYLSYAGKGLSPLKHFLDTKQKIQSSAARVTATFSPGLNFSLRLQGEQQAPSLATALGGAVSPSAPAGLAEASVPSVPRCRPPPPPRTSSPGLTRQGARAQCAEHALPVQAEPNKLAAGKRFCREQCWYRETAGDASPAAALLPWPALSPQAREPCGFSVSRRRSTPSLLCLNTQHNAWRELGPQ